MPALDSTCIHIHCFHLKHLWTEAHHSRFKGSQSERKPYLIQAKKKKEKENHVSPPVLITKSWNRNWNFLVALPLTLTVAAMDGSNNFHGDLNLHMAMCTNDCRALHTNSCLHRHENIIELALIEYSTVLVIYFCLFHEMRLRNAFCISCSNILIPLKKCINHLNELKSGKTVGITYRNTNHIKQYKSVKGNLPRKS